MFDVGMRIKRNYREYTREFDTNAYQLSFLMNELLKNVVFDIVGATDTHFLARVLSGKITRGTIYHLPRCYVTDQFFIEV